MNLASPMVRRRSVRAFLNGTGVRLRIPASILDASLERSLDKALDEPQADRR